MIHLQNMTANYCCVSSYLTMVQHRSLFLSFLSGKCERSWFQNISPIPQLNRVITSCSTKAQMNTNPEGLSIKLHILTAASLMCNVMSFCFMRLKHYLHERRRKQMNPPLTFTITYFFFTFIEEGRNLLSLQLISEWWHRLRANLARQSFFSASATKHYWS